MDLDIFGQAILSLLFVISLIGIIAFAFQKFAIEKKLMKNSERKKLRVLEYQALDAKRRLALIAHEDKEILLLLSPNGETVLNSIDKTKTTKKKATPKK